MSTAATVTHRTVGGTWELCTVVACAMRFHLVGHTPAELTGTPLALLLPLFDAIDPPHRIMGDGRKLWFEDPGSKYLFRAYDLPATIMADGTLVWYTGTGGRMHREGDLPAVIDADGTRMWYRQGLLHRRDTAPAIIRGDGRAEYWVRGKRITYH